MANGPELIHGSLYSGVCNGFSLGARMAGLRTAWVCDTLPYAWQVLAKNFPEAKIIKSDEHIDQFTAVDIISAGFPCQGFSRSGKQQGAEDPRNRWPQCFEVIRAVGPGYVLLENVANLFWLYADTVLADLASIGYTTESFCIPTYAHHGTTVRERLYVVAYAHEVERGRYIPYPDMGHLAQVVQGAKGVKDGESPSDFASRIYGLPLPRISDTGIIGSPDEFPARLDRLAGVGNSNDPLTAYLFFEFIKHHYACLSS